MTIVQVYDWLSVEVYGSLFPAHISKIPQHVGFSIDSKLVSVPDISSLLCCCTRNGVRRITLFDMEGELTRKSKQIAKEVSRPLKTTITMQTGDVIITARYGNIEAQGKSSFPEDRVQIELLSAKLVQRVCNESLQRFCNSSAERKFDFKVGAKSIPDLVIVVGNHFSLKGFPPWLIGAAEIGHMRNLRNVNQALRRRLEQYDRSVQRCGA